MHQILFKCTENYKQISENHTTLLRFNELTRSRPGCSPREVIVLCSYQGEDMLVGPSCEDPCLVTEVEPPAQQTAPFRVPVKVVMDDAGETQRHVAKKRCVLHHMRISCREMTRGKNLMSLQPKENEDESSSKKGSEVHRAREEGEESIPIYWRKKGLGAAGRSVKMSQTFFDLVIHRERVIRPHVGCNQDLSGVL